ncbi:replication-associated recombination protein A [Victivallis sp. Marseille-Q1083]|uniref:replication-associated recombination protein A n=1 Tax=Victivallis sp. Marseille-Q1083 TaxID=2717288 RepID=UPI001C37DD8E|nr:replication-associated recombination protein A [Victivallis sp. Marseille-Q1083]
MEQLNLQMDSGAAEAMPRTEPPPLAARLRPLTLEDYVGQRHLLSPGKLLRRAIDADRFTSIILSGPPGVGKTSLAEVIAAATDAEFIRLSGVTSSVADIRREIGHAVQRRQLAGRKTVLFIDEIHRFNKAQQDSLLPDVENGNIRLVGATTHNPQFYVVGALLSRSMCFQLKPLSEEEIKALIDRALRSPLGYGGEKVELAAEARDWLAKVCEGDGRRALNALELAVMTTPPGLADQIKHVSLAAVEESIQRKFINYSTDEHYDTASAFIKSMRGSDPDAAVYYLAKMLHAGEDIRFIARRIVIFASEDIGNADPRALPLAVSAMQAVDMIGLPEARLILAQAVTFCATAPKSNASCLALDAAGKDVEQQRIQPVPRHLRDPHSAAGREEAGGEEYRYPHDFGGYVVQDYLGVPREYYCPTGNGYEAKIKERLAYFKACRAAAGADEHGN